MTNIKYTNTVSVVVLLSSGLKILRQQLHTSRILRKRKLEYFVNKTQETVDHKFLWKKNLFILPIKNGVYSIIQGEGYVDIPEINGEITVYKTKLDFELKTLQIGNSEMQHIDFAYASSLVRYFLEDESLFLTIRGRKYTPRFDFYVGQHKQLIHAESVQTEVDAGYEGRAKVVLVEVKNSVTRDIIIRQLYYPFRQWKIYSNKEVKILFFEKREEVYSFWEFKFEKENEYNSIYLLKSAKFKIE